MNADQTGTHTCSEHHNNDIEWHRKECIIFCLAKVHIRTDTGTRSAGLLTNGHVDCVWYVCDTPCAGLLYFRSPQQQGHITQGTDWPVLYICLSIKLAWFENWAGPRRSCCSNRTSQLHAYAYLLGIQYYVCTYCIYVYNIYTIQIYRCAFAKWLSHMQRRPDGFAWTNSAQRATEDWHLGLGVLSLTAQFNNIFVCRCLCDN